MIAQNSQGGDINEESRKEYDELYGTITQCMLVAEKQLTSTHQISSSESEVDILTKMKYFKLLQQWVQGQQVNEDVLANIHNKLKIKSYNRHQKEIT